MTGTSQAAAPQPTPDVLAERRRALRALLRNPLLPADGGTSGEYLMVRRHFEWLKQWFADLPAWKLSIDKAVARLRKLPGDPNDPTYSAADSSSGTAFTRRRYALLCLVLAALEQMDHQAALRGIAREVQGYATDRGELRAAGLIFDCDNYDHRRDLMHVVRLLCDIGVLRRIEGEEKVFLNRTDAADVRYEINRHVLSVMLQSSQSPSEIKATEKRVHSPSVSLRISQLADHSLPATDEARNRGLRARLLRSLLDSPVLYFHELSTEEKAYLEKHRNHLLREVHDSTGLIAEVRHEGIAMVDDLGDLTDIRLPDYGSEGQYILPLAQWFVRCLKNDSERAIPFPEVEAQLRRIVHISDAEVSNENPETGTVSRRTHDLLLRLRALRLIQFTASGVRPQPAICRYAAEPAAEVHDDRSGIR